MSTNDPSGFKATSSKIFSTSNHLFIYAKNAIIGSLNKLYTKKEYDKNYKYYIENPDEHFSKWQYSLVADAVCKELGISTKEFKAQYNQNQRDDILAEFANKNRNRVFRTAAIGGGALNKRRETVNRSKENKGVVFQHPNEELENFYILNGECIVFWGDLFHDVDGENVAASPLTDIWTDIKWTGIAGEGGVKLKNGKKPEKLLERIISLTTNKGDLVLDYHLGSGTTVAVAHKMERRWIGIEQLDYGDNDSVVRIKNVVEGDSSGVSKKYNWNGGGSFVYCELANANQIFVDEIQKASSTEEIKDIYSRIIETGFISSKINPKDIDANADDFYALSIDNQKRFLMELLDKNLLYVNYCDIDDEEYGICDEDKAFTRSFYGEV